MKIDPPRPQQPGRRPYSGRKPQVPRFLDFSGHLARHAGLLRTRGIDQEISTNTHMKTKPTKTGPKSAETTACLLPLDQAGFTTILKTMTCETPEDFTGHRATRELEAASRLAWCEVTEASIRTNDAPAKAKMAEIVAQRKLTRILDDLLPIVADRNKAVAAAALQREFHGYIKGEAEPLQSELAELKERDLRINESGELPNPDAMQDQINYIKKYLDHGEWKRASLDFRDTEFEKGLRQMRDVGRYQGELTKDAAEGRIEELQAQYDQALSRFEHMLSAEEIIRLNQIDVKMAAMLADIEAAEGEAAALEAEAAAANEGLKVKIEAAGIIGLAVIQAYQMQTSSTPAAA